MSDDPEFLKEAERLSRTAAETASASEKRMLQIHARFYEALSHSEDDAPSPALDDDLPESI
jgi:hypothetical protein